MDTILTLVIALGGISTGIGAIWAALAARRQARLTEQSLAEQNERASLNLALDLLSRLADRFESPHFLGRRRAAAKFLLEHAFVEDDIVVMRQLHPALREVGNFFERMGLYYRLDALPSEAVELFGGWVEAYWRASEPTVVRIRQEWHQPGIYEEWEYLKQMAVDGPNGEPLDYEHLRIVLEAESVVGEESLGKDK